MRHYFFLGIDKINPKINHISCVQVVILPKIRLYAGKILFKYNLFSLLAQVLNAFDDNEPK